MWTKRLRVLVFVAFVLAASGANGDPGGEPEFCTITAKEVARHLVLETDQFRAVFGDVQCKKQYNESFRVQVAGEPYYARGIPKIRDPGAWVKIPPILFPVVKRRGRQAPVELRYDDETLVQIPAGGTTVVIGEQQFDITGKKRTLLVDAAGRVRESDLVLRARTFEEVLHFSRPRSFAYLLHSDPYRMGSKERNQLLQKHSASDLQLILQHFQQGEIVKKGLQEAFQQENIADSEPPRTWLHAWEMIVVRQEGATESSGDTSAVQEDKYAEEYPSTSSGFQLVFWRGGSYRGKLAMDFMEAGSPPTIWQSVPNGRVPRPNETGRGVTIVFEGYPWSMNDIGARGLIKVFGDPAPVVAGSRRSDATREIQCSYARHASGSFPKHVATIRVEGGPFGDWVMRITEGGKKLRVGESVIDLTGPKKQILFKYDGSIEVGDEADPKE